MTRHPLLLAGTLTGAGLLAIACHGDDNFMSPAATTDPTGIVFNGSANNFGGAHFIFDGEGGTIAAWTDGTAAVEKFAAGDGAVYKGLALIGSCLYTTDFHNNKIDVFSSTFAKVTAGGGACPQGSAFADNTLPAGFAPFGIQNIGGKLYVTYAQQDNPADAHDNTNGDHLGYVNVFNADGSGKTRFASQGVLNAPWGVAQAPNNFGALSGDILIGNFGDGRINAFTTGGTFVDSVKNSGGTAIVLDGLWGIAFGNGINSQPANTLFFAAGTNDEANGLYGRIDVGQTNYTAMNLVSDDLAGHPAAAHTDSDLVNPWGIVFNPNGLVWVANNHTNTATLYDGNGVKNALVVTLP